MSPFNPRPVFHLSGRDFPVPVPGRLLIGRDPEADVVVEDDRVSWRHAEVTCTDGPVEIRDLGSGNGPWVDGIRLGGGPHQLGEAATVTVGGTRLRYAGSSPQVHSSRSDPPADAVRLDRS